MASSGCFLGLRTSGISAKFDSRGVNDGDCENLVGFLVRRLGRCEFIVASFRKGGQ